MELTTLANTQGKALKKRRNKEGFANFNNMPTINQLSDYQSQINDATDASTLMESEGQDIVQTINPVSQSLSDSYTQQLNDLDTEESNRNTIINNYLNTVSSSDQYLGQNVQFSNATGYITAQGIYKNYGGNGVIFNTTAGQNNCPSSTVSYPIQNATIPYDQIGGTSQNASYTFVVGTPMKSNQSCGNEGQNVFVDSVHSDPSATLLGSYMDSIESPLMTFLDNGNSSFTYETCLQAAVNNGYTFFGLQSADPSQPNTEQLVQCAVSNDGDTAMTLGEAQTSCTQQSDGYVYGGPQSIALYKTPSYMYISAFNDNPSRAMTGWVNGGSQTFSTEQCYNYALANGYPFFGLQNGSNPSNAQCFVSDDYNATTQYGETSNVRYSKVDKTYYGGGWANAVYQIINDADNLGCIALQTKGESDPPMTVLSQNSDFETCQSTAASNGYTYFGLSGGGPGEATCYASKNKKEAQQYGPYEPEVTLPDGHLYGTYSVNTIYKVKGVSDADPGNLGNVGYVTGDTTLLPYPPELLSNESSTQYSKVQNMVEPNDIGEPTLTSSSVSECQAQCNESSSCGGFYFDNSNNCFLQPINFLQDNATSTQGNSSSLATADAFIRVPAVNNSSTCSKQINNISANIWQNYPQNGMTMTDTQPCGLEAATQESTNQINSTSNILNSMFGGISDIHNSYQTYLEGFDNGPGGGNNGLFGRIGDNSDAIRDSALFLQQVESSMPQQMSNQMVKVSGISVLQNYTNYSTMFTMAFIFLILAAIIFFATLQA